MAITRQQIFETALQLEAGGHAATLAAIRKALGGGSYTTISEAMKERKATLAPRPPIKEAAPLALASRLTDLGANLWAEAIAMANDRLAKERSAMEAHRAEWEASRKEAADRADQLAAELDAKKQESAEVASQVAALRAQLDAATESHARAKSKTQADAVQIEQMAARIEDAHAVAKRAADAHAKALLAAQTRHDETQRKIVVAQAQAATARAETAALSKAQESGRLAQMQSRVESPPIEGLPTANAGRDRH